MNEADKILLRFQSIDCSEFDCNNCPSINLCEQSSKYLIESGYVDLDGNVLLEESEYMEDEE